MKRTISLVLSFMLVFVALVGCIPSNEPKENSPLDKWEEMLVDQSVEVKMATIQATLLTSSIAPELKILIASDIKELANLFDRLTLLKSEEPYYPGVEYTYKICLGSNTLACDENGNTSITEWEDKVNSGLTLYVDKDGYVRVGVGESTWTAEEWYKSTSPIDVKKLRELYNKADKIWITSAVENGRYEYTAHQIGISSAQDFEKEFGNDKIDKISYQYEMQTLDDGQRADVTLYLEIFIGENAYTAVAKGKINAYELPSGDVLWEGSLDGELVISDKIFNMTAGFAKVTSTNELSLSLTLQREPDTLFALFFGDYVMKGEVLDFFKNRVS